MSEMNSEELEQYTRHLNLPEIGLEGQKKLKAAKVLCVGAGGLGSPALLYLAAAGIGTLGIVDNDCVNLSNLQRQILYTHQDINKKKVLCAQNHLKDINPFLTYDIYDIRLTKNNAVDIFKKYDVIVDGSDNFMTHLLVNDVCAFLKIPTVFASISQFKGQISVFNAPKGPCYRCLFPFAEKAKTPTCSEAGVLGVLPGLIGSLQATETIKLILKRGKPLIGRVLTYDALALTFKEFSIKLNSECTVCNQQQTFQTLNYQETGECNMNAPSLPSIDVFELSELREQNKDIFILDVRDPYEYAICNIGGHLIPLNELPARMDEIDKEKEIIVHCKLGGRSAHAAHFLLQSGFKQVKNLTGGIDAWCKYIDPTLERY